MVSLRTAAQDDWLQEFIAKLVKTYPQIEEIYLLGDKARGVIGQLPDYNVLIFAGYENALELLMTLARAQYQLCPPDSDAMVHMYVENYGGTLNGIWGGGLLQNEATKQWREARDYLLVYARDTSQKKRLGARILDPIERRQQERRLTERRHNDRGDADRRATDRRLGQPIEAAFEF